MTQPTRRTTLRLVGAASGVLGLGSATSQAQGSETHELCIHAPSTRSYQYSFAAAGKIRQRDTATQAPIDQVTADAEDDIDDCEVHGWTRGGWDCYTFSGELLAFNLPNQWISEYTVYFDGEQVHPNDLWTGKNPDEVDCSAGNQEVETEEQTQIEEQEPEQNQGFCPLENSVTVSRSTKANSVKDPLTFDIAVTGVLELENGRRVSRVRGEVPPRTPGAPRERKRFDYSGEITRLEVSGPGSVSLLQKNPCKPND